jgi:hypothetical protein
VTLNGVTQSSSAPLIAPGVSFFSAGSATGHSPVEWPVQGSRTDRFSQRMLSQLNTFSVPSKSLAKVPPPALNAKILYPVRRICCDVSKDIENLLLS